MVRDAGDDCGHIIFRCVADDVAKDYPLERARRRFREVRARTADVSTVLPSAAPNDLTLNANPLGSCANERRT
jgi:hypothetical protein